VTFMVMCACRLYNYVRLRMVNGEGMFYGDVRKSGCIWLIGSDHLPRSS
jgi:hypothetical protein